MRILFIGQSWLGSCARSLKEALARNPQVILDEVNEDLFIPKHRARWLRAINRLLKPAHRQELYRQIRYRVEVFKPDVVMTYKGHPLEAGFIRQLQALGCSVVNVYPDCSPHAHGAEHRQAVGAYDLVISTKPFHPAVWKSVYGYNNPCIFMPQGYDPHLHLMTDPPCNPRFDLTLVATWRAEYGELIKALGQLLFSRGVTVGIGGNGWAAHRKDYPTDWVFAGELQGQTYIDWLRQGRICLAPVTREVVIAGVRQPGDEDSTRTYELAAAHCFFIHRRTGFVQEIYDETTEVPLFDTVEELAEKIIYFLPLEDERQRMASAAHRRAVPAYSINERASQIVNKIHYLVKVRQ
ncbi:MAG TPA: glycosyltransferase [Candidatus Competibacter sp.]|nr:glycosyltransferase [Candidatus Competibacter sp.]